MRWASPSQNRIPLLAGSPNLRFGKLRLAADPYHFGVLSAGLPVCAVPLSPVFDWLSTWWPSRAPAKGAAVASFSAYRIERAQALGLRRFFANARLTLRWNATSPFLKSL